MIKNVPGENKMVKICRAFNITLFLGMLIATCLVLSGCDAGSNNPTATELSTGTGYNIKIISYAEMVAVNGTNIITVAVFEPDGSPIRDNEDVIFACPDGGSFSESPVKTLNGQASTVYTADDTPNKYATIQVTCRGTGATIPIIIVPANS